MSKNNPVLENLDVHPSIDFTPSENPEEIKCFGKDTPEHGYISELNDEDFGKYVEYLETKGCCLTHNKETDEYCLKNCETIAEDTSNLNEDFKKIPYIPTADLKVNDKIYMEWDGVCLCTVASVSGSPITKNTKITLKRENGDEMVYTGQELADERIKKGEKIAGVVITEAAKEKDVIDYLEKEMKNAGDVNVDAAAKKFGMPVEKITSLLDTINEEEEEEIMEITESTTKEEAQEIVNKLESKNPEELTDDEKKLIEEAKKILEVSEDDDNGPLPTFENFQKKNPARKIFEAEQGGAGKNDKEGGSTGFVSNDKGSNMNKRSGIPAEGERKEGSGRLPSVKQFITERKEMIRRAAMIKENLSGLKAGDTVTMTSSVKFITEGEEKKEILSQGDKVKVASVSTEEGEIEVEKDGKKIEVPGSAVSMKSEVSEGEDGELFGKQIKMINKWFETYDGAEEFKWNGSKLELFDKEGKNLKTLSTEDVEKEIPGFPKAING